MDTQPPQPGRSWSESSPLVGASSNMSLIGTQQERRHQLVHCNAANAVTKNMTQDAHLKIVGKTGTSTNKKQLAVGWEYIHTVVNGRQIAVCHTVGVLRELRDQFIATRIGKPPWSTKTFVRTVHKIEHHDEVTSGIFADEFRDMHPREWTKQALITTE